MSSHAKQTPAAAAMRIRDPWPVEPLDPVVAGRVLIGGNKSTTTKNSTEKELQLSLGCLCDLKCVIFVTILILAVISTHHSTEAAKQPPSSSSSAHIGRMQVHETGSDVTDATTTTRSLRRSVRHAATWESAPAIENEMITIANNRNLDNVLSNLSELAKVNQTEIRFNSEAERYILIVNLVAETAVLFIGLLGNGAVIAIILFFTRGDSVADVYILHLAFADITFLAGLGFLFATSINDHWVFGNIVCKIFMSLTALNQFASSLLLSLMSFDRYLAVCHPIFSQRYRRPTPARLICYLVWVLCFVLMIPIFMHARTDERDNTCGIFWPDSGIHERVFTLYSFCIGFLLPLVLIVVFYRCVVVKLKSTASGGLSERRNKNRETTNKRVTNLVRAIVLTYGVCWLPYWVGQMLIGFSQPEPAAKEPNQQPGVEYVGPYYTFNQVAACLSYLNSAVNPILYAFLSDSFRRRCSQFWQRLLSFRLFKRWHNPTAAGTGNVGGTQASISENPNHNHQHNQQQPAMKQYRHSRAQLDVNNSAGFCRKKEADAENNDNLSVRQSVRTRTTNVSASGVAADLLADDTADQDQPTCNQQEQASHLVGLLLPPGKAGADPEHDNNTSEQLFVSATATTKQQTTFRKKILSNMNRRLRLKRRKKKQHSQVELNHVSDNNVNGGGETILLASAQTN